MQEGNGLASLDSTTLELCLSYVSAKDLLTSVMLVSKAVRAAASSQLVWGIQFLRDFGHDYWGENAPLHPYLTKDIPPFDEEEYKRMFRQDVIPSFSSRSEWKTSDTEKIPLNLPLYFQDHSNETWKDLYRNYHQMRKTWLAPADELIIIAGLPSTGKSAILGAFKRHLATVTIDDLRRHRYWSYSSRNLKPEQPALKDRGMAPIYSSPGCCKVVRGVLPSQHYSEKLVTIVNIVEIRKPRNWYPLFRHPTDTSTLDQLPETEEDPDGYARDPPERAKEVKNIFYLVDCEKMKDTEYQNEVYREFHGMCGEAAPCRELRIVLYLMKTAKPGALSQQDILRILKISLYKSPGHMCPHYAGPVVICVMEVNFDSQTESEEEVNKKLKSAMKQAVYWLMKPLRTPSWYARRRSQTICLLKAFDDL